VSGNPKALSQRKHAADTHRAPEIVLEFHRLAEGSCLYRSGGTAVLCTASVDTSVPSFLEGTGKGWITAEYEMHPRANPARREQREGRGRQLKGRTQEIQRLIGRALRAAIDLEALGQRSVTIDCDVLEADGGTRTASITGGFLALCLAIARLQKRGDLSKPVLRDQVAAVSVGHVGGVMLLDLNYAEDSRARMDLNLVATGQGDIVEVQAAAEDRAIPRADLEAMISLALQGTASLCEVQNRALAAHGISLASLLQPSVRPS